RTDAWLSSANPSAALRRLVSESRAGVERALRAQSADAAAAGAEPPAVRVLGRPVLCRAPFALLLEPADERGEGGGGDGEGGAGRVLGTADGYACACCLGYLHARVAVTAARVGRLPPDVRRGHRVPPGSVVSPWTRSRERSGSSATASTLRKSVLKTSS